MENNIEELFKSLFGSEEEQEEAAEYNFSSESDIDDSIEKVLEINTDIKRFESLYKDKLVKVKAEFDTKITQLKKKKEWLEFNLKNSVLQSDDKKETDTQFKKSYLSGNIIVKKSKTNMLKPELTPEEIIRDFADYKKEDTKITLDWKSLKADLKILNGLVMNTKSGEILDSILTETVPEIVVIK